MHHLLLTMTPLLSLDTLFSCAIVIIAATFFATAAKSPKNSEVYHGRRALRFVCSLSTTVFDVITRASNTTEKRLMVDFAATRDSYNNHEISNVGLVTHATNIADGLTKPTFCKALDTVLSSGFDRTPVVQ
eukprot:IDg2100t1